MRRALLIFLLISLFIITLLVRSVSTLLSLLVENAAADAILGAELPSPNSSLIEQLPQIIPKIIHQTYKNDTIPEVWFDAQQTCIDLHPDYEYIVRLSRDPTQFRTYRCFSCGRMKSRATLLPPNIPGFSRPLTAINIPFSAQIHFVISFWHTTAEHISIWMMYSST
jgi:hypothetical protein